VTGGVQFTLCTSYSNSGSSKTSQPLKWKKNKYDISLSFCFFSVKYYRRNKNGLYSSFNLFTLWQIFELEKRFLYQKYLSPADRDEIAAQLGLSNAQVRTIINLQYDESM
jgi:hypothetical protein